MKKITKILCGIAIGVCMIAATSCSREVGEGTSVKDTTTTTVTTVTDAETSIIGEITTTTTETTTSEDTETTTVEETTTTEAEVVEAETSIQECA